MESNSGKLIRRGSVRRNSTNFNGVWQFLKELAKAKGERVFQELVQGAGRENAAIGAMEQIAITRDGWNDEGKGAAARAIGVSLPTPAVANTLADERHCVVDQAGQDKIAFFTWWQGAILSIQNF